MASPHSISSGPIRNSCSSTVVEASASRTIEPAPLSAPLALALALAFFPRPRDGADDDDVEPDDVDPPLVARLAVVLAEGLEVKTDKENIWAQK